ncbi:MAG: ATP-binding cassette domain-containing protein [Roseburia sp.]|nr:ATP-binding cassette domain-containing protein [Roseburia sp.]
MLKVTELSYGFPQKDLYNKISFTVEDGQHCVLIGTNGTGKSTLLQMLLEPQEYLYEGKIEIEPGSRIGYVSQFPGKNENSDQTVFDYISEPFVRQQEKINQICGEMEHGENMDELFEQYQTEWDVFQAMDGDHYEVNIKKQLKLAGLEKSAQLKTSELSGGEYKLVSMIREMLTGPALLIMDEPDAFLDFENVNALRNLINQHKGTLLVVTHNRYLLNHCFDKVLHLENTELQEFDGSYVDYHYLMLQTKIEQMELAASDLAEIERNQKIVERLRKQATLIVSAARGRALHARVSLLERLQARKTRLPFIEVPHPQINLHTDLVEEEKEDVVLKVEDYSVSFDEQLLEHVSFEIGPKDKVAIVGSNGTGKTTLLREIMHGGNDSIWIAPEAEVAYLSQMQGETMDESQTVLEIMDATGLETKKEVLEYLSPYGFAEDMLEQRIDSLSGGEKNLLQLAVLSRGNASLLLLDEPTSHLDIYAQESLEEAILGYNGAVLMVSHDFYTIANCVDYVLYVEDKTVRRVSARKFRKMIYADHFDKDYLELEKKKKETEVRIYQALGKRDYETARTLSDQMGELIAAMQK